MNWRKSRYQMARPGRWAASSYPVYSNPSSMDSNSKWHSPRRVSGKDLRAPAKPGTREWEISWTQEYRGGAGSGPEFCIIARSRRTETSLLVESFLARFTHSTLGNL